MPFDSVTNFVKNTLLDTAWLSMGYATFNKLPDGISFTGGKHAATVKFLYDITWMDESGQRQIEQQVFDEFFEIIRNAKKLILIDMFLFNDFRGVLPVGHRPLCEELTSLLIARKEACPDIDIWFTTDPINTVYGGLQNLYLDRLDEAGINVVVTNLDRLRDSNPIYSFFWRLLVRPWGNNAESGWMRSPFSDDRVTLRSYLKLFNLKANHRKTLVADDGDSSWVGMVCTGNPHDGSSSHRNVAIKFDGPAVSDLYLTETAVLELSGAGAPAHQPKDIISAQSEARLQILTEKQIKQAVLRVIDELHAGDELALILFYISDMQIIRSLQDASSRGAEIRIILDPNKDAFGLPKSGIPNRPVAQGLVRYGINVRWADTHGEQCHSKLLVAHRAGKESVVLLGSANFTRRNLDDFNLETDAMVYAPRSAECIQSVEQMFERLWGNEPGRRYSTDYDKYDDVGRWRYLLYWLMEKTGISTF